MPILQGYGRQITCNVSPQPWRNTTAKVLLVVFPIEIVKLILALMPQDYLSSSFIRQCERYMDIEDIHIKFTNRYFYITVCNNDQIEVEVTDLRTLEKKEFSRGPSLYANEWMDHHEDLAKLDNQIAEFTGDDGEIPSVEAPATPEILRCITDNHRPTVHHTRRLCVVDACGIVRLFYHK